MHFNRTEEELTTDWADPIKALKPRLPMDIKTRILRWEHAIGENPAILVLIIISAIAVVFLSAMYFDSFIKYRRRKKHRRGPN